MKFRGIRLGAVLLPLGVAILPLSVLIWYGAVRIPRQEAYLSERNLRLLTTLSGPIKAKIESFDGALDHAVESFRPTSEADLRKFQQGVRLFAPDLDVLALTVTKKGSADAKRETGSSGPSGIEDQMLAGADDPPRVQIERDEGRHYLYLGAKQDVDGDSIVRTVARSDLEALVAPFLDSPEFAAILLTDDKGEVFVQRSPLGLTLARLDGVISSRLAKDSNSQAVTFDSLSTFSNTMQVTIGGVDYKLYMQPVSLSLLSMKKSAGGGRDAEQWVLCGLVRADRFKADSSSLSYTTLLWFSGFLAALALAIPFVKLRALHARERLRASDVGWVTATTFAAIGLLTLGVLDIIAFGSRFGHAVDDRLRAVAINLARNVTLEVDAINKQGETFESNIAPTFGEVSQQLRQNHRSSPRILVGDEDPPHLTCDPPHACRARVLESPPGQWDYPFFDLATWAGDDGWQRVRWTPARGIRPFLNIFDEKLAYAQRVRAAWQAPNASPVKGVDVLSSPNTGEPLTVFWRTSPKSNPRWVQSLAMANLVSLDRPILPKDVSFAVVDRDGQVLFHAVRSHRLREHLLMEVEDDARLRSLVQNGETDVVSARYQGRPYRFYIAPLKLGALGDRDPGWRLAVFQDSTVIDTVNLETLTIASWLFAVYAGVLAMSAALIYGFTREDPRKWFWPDAGKSSSYRSAALLNGAAIAIFVVLFVASGLLRSTSALLVATATLAVATAVTTYRIVVGAKAAPSPTGTFGFWHPFFVARSAFLVVVAALPAIACFEVAYTFEATLLAKSESAQADKDNRELSSRLGAEQNPAFADKRRSFASGTYASLWPPSEGTTADAIGSATLNNVLLKMHRRYNDAALALESAAGVATGPQPPPQLLHVGWLVLIVGCLSAACHAFVYWLVRPMFVLDAVAPPVFTPASGDAPSGRVLVFGPPGSGKSTRLAEDPEIRIFDVATLAYLERRTKIRGVQFERRRVAGTPISVLASVEWDWSGAQPFERAASVPVPRGPGWAAAVSDATLPPVLGIDHLDYRLDEPAFAAETLKFVERATYRDRCTVRIASDRDPLACLRDRGTPPDELDRWARVLRSFRKETVGLGRRGKSQIDSSKEAVGASTNASSQVTEVIRKECREIPALVRIADDVLRTFHQSTTADEALAAFGAAASPYYEALWNACTSDERLLLHQIAEEGVVNPQNHAVVRDLMKVGLIVRNRAVEIMNTTFCEFVLNAPSANEVSTWERRGVAIPWASVEIAMMTVVVILAGLLVVTQEQLLHAWIGFLPTLLPAAQKLWKTVTALRPPAKAGAVLAS
jgi:hypothetical protein